MLEIKGLKNKMLLTIESKNKFLAAFSNPKEGDTYHTREGTFQFSEIKNEWVKVS